MRPTSGYNARQCEHMRTTVSTYPAVQAQGILNNFAGFDWPPSANFSIILTEVGTPDTPDNKLETSTTNEETSARSTPYGAINSFSRVPILRRLNVTPIPDIRSIRLLRRIVLRTRIRRHLRQPTRRRHTRLIMNRAEQRREALKKVPDRRHGVRCSVALGARVPDVDLRLQALDSVCVCVRETLVGAVCEHEVLHLRRYPR
jgi:hypothetical protein